MTVICFSLLSFHPTTLDPPSLTLHARFASSKLGLSLILLLDLAPLATSHVGCKCGASLQYLHANPPTYTCKQHDKSATRGSSLYRMSLNYRFVYFIPCALSFSRQNQSTFYCTQVTLWPRATWRKTRVCNFPGDFASHDLIMSRVWLSTLKQC